MNDGALSSLRRAAWRRGACALAAAGLMTLAACGSGDAQGDKKDGVASAEDASGGGGDAGGAATTVANDPQLVMADYQECMEDEGIDPGLFEMEEGGNEVDGEGSADFTVPADFDIETYEAASEVCDPILDNFDPYAGMSDEEKAAADEYLLNMQNCMKDKGFDIPMGPADGNSVGDESDVDVTLPADTDWEALEVASRECDEEVELPEVLKEMEEEAANSQP